MTYTPITPFGRSLNAVVLKHQQNAIVEDAPDGANKWEVLRELATARQAFGLTDRDMTVLQTLVSFHQATILGGNDANLVVYPSNKAICERLNGMPCSTMRRHVGHLVTAGVILRRDSPNGKRYARTYGDEKVAYGFDLTPLAARFQEFCHAARAVRDAAERFKRLRETVSLMRRDLAGLAAYGAEIRPERPEWGVFIELTVQVTRELRRKLSMDALDEMKVVLDRALNRGRDIFDLSITENMSTSDLQNEHHIQNSNLDSYDLEPCLEKAKGRGGSSEETAEPVGTEETENANLPRIPLGLVLATCKEFKTYHQDPVRHWHHLVTAADSIRPMLGISPSAWDDARHAMGPEQAAVVLLAMLERFEDIRSPGGYLRTLTAKADQGAFSCGPMVMALTRSQAA
ncbi:MAG: plasmid replication protein RepC [Paracoccaceae bacterium]